MLFDSTMRKDNRWRIISEQGGELSLKHTLVTRSMKNALHCSLNWACWSTTTLQKKNHMSRSTELQRDSQAFLQLTDRTASDGTIWKSSLTSCMQKGQNI